MIVRFFSSLVLVGAACLAAVPLAVGADPVRLASLDPSIRIVVPCGIWKDGDHYGSARVIVYGLGWEHVRSFVSAEWLLHDDASQTVSVLKSAPIKELNEDSWANVDSVRFVRADGIGVVEIAYRLRHKEKPETIRLQLGLPGVYKVEGRSK